MHVNKMNGVYIKYHSVNILKTNLPILNKKFNLPLDSKYIAHDLSFVTTQFPLLTKLILH